MTRNLGLSVLTGIALALLPAIVAADNLAIPNTPESPTKPIPMVSVLQCLKGVHDPDGLPLIVVRANEITVPIADLAGGELPSTLEQIESTYHLMRRKFGSVAALVPDTKTELSVDFPPIDPDAGLRPSQAFQLLAASLDNGLWGKLTSMSGLGYGDLSTESQRHLWDLSFGASGKLSVKTIHENQADFATDKSANQGIDITDKIHAIRIKLQRTVGIYLDNHNDGIVEPNAPSTLAPGYVLVSEKTDDVDHQWSPVKVSPNTQKPTDIDFANLRLDPRITVEQQTTVGQLATRIATATKIRLFCNPAFVMKSVNVVDGTVPVRCGDLLQALCLSLTGTVRRVGRDYALTNDLVGFGAKSAMFGEYRDHEAAIQRVPLDEASDKLAANHSPDNLPLGTVLGEGQTPGDLSESEKELTGSDILSASNPGMSFVKLDISQLTPQQTQYLHSIYGPKFASHGGTEPVAKSAVLMTNLKASIVVPGIDGDVEAVELSVDRLFSGSSAEMIARIHQQSKQTQNVPDPDDFSKSIARMSFRDIFKNVPDRAVIAAPNSETEILEMLPLVKHLGFNHLWVDLFANTFSKSDAEVGARHLIAAVRAGKKLGVRVSPIVDVLHSSEDNFNKGYELNIRGETAVEQAHRTVGWYVKTGIKPPAWVNEGNLNTLSPATPAAWERFKNISGALNSSIVVPAPILAGAGLLGYDNNVYATKDDFGYVLSNRIGYLEQTGIDPIDIPEVNDESQVVFLPLFSSVDVPQKFSLRQQWITFRFEKLIRFLRLIRPTISKPSEPLLVEDVGRVRNGWFGSWDSPSAPLPQYHYTGESGSDIPVYPNDDSLQARMQSRYSYAKVNLRNGVDLDSVTYQANRVLLHRHWKAVALNLDPNLYDRGEIKSTSLDVLRSLDKELIESERKAHSASVNK